MLRARTLLAIAQFLMAVMLAHSDGRKRIG